MTDPFDFEPRFEARLTAHAARASRPFDASAIAAAAAASPSPGVTVRAWARPLAGRDGRLSTLRVAFAMVLLAVAVTAGTILVGAALRGQPPLPDHLAVVPPTASVAPTPILEDRPTAVPEETPPASTPRPAPATPAPTSSRLALIRLGASHCGGLVTTIEVASGASRNEGGGCFSHTALYPGGRAIVGGGSYVTDPADPNAIMDTGDPNAFTFVDLRDRTTETIRTNLGWSPLGRWQVIRRDGDLYSIRAGDRPVADTTGWIDLPKLAGTSGLFWSPDESRLGFQTADGYVIGNGDGTDLHVLAGIPWIWSWSADGSRIAFPHPSAFREVWVGNWDGTDQVKVSDRAGFAPPGVELSADGRSIAILESGHLLRWRLSDGAWRELDLGVNLDGREPRIQWTPAGDGLVVSAGNDPDGNGGPGITFLVSIDGTLLARVDGSHPVWSPDGNRFAVSVSPGELDPHGTTAPISTKARGTVYVIARDGTTVRVKDAYEPAWSPDGSSIAVVTGDSIAAGIAVLAADGSGRRTIPKATFGNPNGLTWVP